MTIKLFFGLALITGCGTAVSAPRAPRAEAAVKVSAPQVSHVSYAPPGQMEMEWTPTEEPVESAAPIQSRVTPEFASMKARGGLFVLPAH